MTIQDFKMQVLPFNEKLYYVAYRYLKNPADAEDAVQDVFVKLWNIRDKLSSYRSIEAFAYTVMKNHCLDKLKAKRTYSIEDSMYIEPNQKNATPELVTLSKEKFAMVEQIIDKLPPLQKAVIKLRDMEELEFNEIAERLGIEVNAIRVNLSRARKKVRDEIEKIYEYNTSTAHI